MRDISSGGLSDQLLARLPELLESMDLSDSQAAELRKLGASNLMARVQEAKEDQKRLRRLAKGRADTARLLELKRDRKQALCPHGLQTVTGFRTFLSGQIVRGHLLMVCQGCRKAFSEPAQPGLPSPERRLLPKADWIGGARKPYEDVLRSEHPIEDLPSLNIEE